MRKFAGNQQKELAIKTEFIEFSRTGCEIGEPIIDQLDNRMSLIETKLLYRLFGRRDEGRDQGIVATGMDNAIVHILAALGITEPRPDMNLMTAQPQQQNVANGIIRTACDDNATHRDEPITMMHFDPLSIGIVMHIIYHSLQLTTLVEDGVVIVCLKETDILWAHCTQRFRGRRTGDTISRAI